MSLITAIALIIAGASFLVFTVQSMETIAKALERIADVLAEVLIILNRLDRGER